ncbi:MAG: Protein tyrosine and serine/threonine kinase [Chlamydiales bacterium]|nr:Protein tyrosine and serine/threonine kinase [Chlamydiales bacterium]
MNLFERLEYGFQSDIGAILLSLVVILICLCAIYLFISRQKKQRDLLAAKYYEYYATAEQVAISHKFAFIGAHIAELFGRKTIVKTAAQQYAVCLIPPPNLVHKKFFERWLFFLKARAHQQLPLFAPCNWVHSAHPFIFVQDELVRSDGRLRLRLSEYRLDNTLATVDYEKILLEIAAALTELHQLQTETGEKLYYGWLLPSSIYIELDPTRKVTKIVLEDLGLCYALEAEGMRELLQKLHKGKLMASLGYITELKGLIKGIAPEFLDKTLVKNLGIAADMYMFATTALYLFTGKVFSSIDKINWSDIPHRWQSFLKKCLAIDPKERPLDFLELQDSLNDPESILTLQTSIKTISSVPESAKNKLGPDNIEEIVELSNLVKEIQQVGKGQVGIDAALNKSIATIENFLDKKKWKHAKKLCKELLSAVTDKDTRVGLTPIYIQLAIACYELEEFSEAEKYYLEAKKLDSSLAKRFREHIAFRI